MTDKLFLTDTHRDKDILQRQILQSAERPEQLAFKIKKWRAGISSSEESGNPAQGLAEASDAETIHVSSKSIEDQARHWGKKAGMANAGRGARNTTYPYVSQLLQQQPGGVPMGPPTTGMNQPASNSYADFLTGKARWITAVKRQGDNLDKGSDSKRHASATSADHDEPAAGQKAEALPRGIEEKPRKGRGD